jgi:SAM-dependent methyltransferase
LTIHLLRDYSRKLNKHCLVNEDLPMLKEESIWIRGVLEETDLSSVREVLDVGSSTKKFRTQKQPYIDENVFRPLREQNKTIYYLDQKIGEGIDFVYDIENLRAEEIGRKFEMVVCCNLLEHVRKPKELASLLIGLTGDNGFLLITVPKAYRHHPDPIDTMFRPSMEELVSMFPGMKVVSKDVIRIRERARYTVTEFVRYIIPFLNWKVNCLFMQKI